MCLATPLKVLKLDKDKATVAAFGKKSTVDISLLKKIKIGDYLYASQDLAIKKIARGDAQRVLQLVKSWHG